MKLTKSKLKEMIREELLKESGEERRILSIENMKQGQTIGDKKMKLTKSKLKEIIRREIQNLNEGLPWEHGLDEGWFSDMKATAQKAYIKAHPDSKYAKGVKSGDKDAPMTGKEKAIADKEKKEKQDAEDSAREKQEREEFGERETSYVTAEFGDDQKKARAFFSDDPAQKRQAMKDVKNKLEKETGFSLNTHNIDKAVKSGQLDDGYGGLSEPLGNLLENPNKKTLKAFNDALMANKEGRYGGKGIEGWGFGVSAKTAKTRAAKKAAQDAEKKAAQDAEKTGDSGKRKKSDFVSSFSKAARGRGF